MLGQARALKLPDADQERMFPAVGNREIENGFPPKGKLIFFGVKFSSGPNRLFDMFRMRGLKRAAAAISGNGCYFGLVAGDGVSLIEVPLGSSRR